MSDKNTDPMRWPKVSEADKKAALKDDCFDLPKPGSDYAKSLQAQGEITFRHLIEQGLLPKDFLSEPK